MPKASTLRPGGELKTANDRSQKLVKLMPQLGHLRYSDGMLITSVFSDKQTFSKPVGTLRSAKIGGAFDDTAAGN